jgi:predicted MFS family arabinose efflux permease
MTAPRNRSGRPTPDRLALRLLAVGMFAIGTDGYVIAGILPPVAADLGASVAAAGQLVTVFAVAYAVGSPVLSAVAERMCRRRLLIVAMLTFMLANALAAAASSYAVLAVARVAAALSAAVFVPNALAASSELVSEHRRGRALAAVTAGLTVATALGVPLGTFIGNAVDWRATFALVAALGALATGGLLHALPALERPRAVGLRDRLALARSPAVLAALGVTVVSLTAGFTVYTYISPIVQTAASVGSNGVSAILLVFGVTAIIGNTLGGHGSDRLGPFQTMGLGLAGMAGALTGLGVLAAAPPQSDVIAFALTATAVALWSISGWAIAVPVEHRLIAVAPHAPALALALNASALYTGIALGGAVGGAALDIGSPATLGFIGGSLALAAIALLLYSARLAHLASPRLTMSRPLSACETERLERGCVGHAGGTGPMP